ncbi:hypothetical protein ACI3PL_28175, partial [Lacticaseibacillus paracasei]
MRDLATVGFGTLIGGVMESIHGGNFWQGTAKGLSVSLLNHTFHEIIIRGNKTEFLLRKADRFLNELIKENASLNAQSG